MEDEDVDKSSTDMFQSLDKLSPRVVGATSPFAGGRKGDNILSILLEEKEEDDVDDSLDRSKTTDSRNTAAKKPTSEVKDVEEVKEEVVRESDVFNRDFANLRPESVLQNKSK
jgi:hypothetical protein